MTTPQTPMDRLLYLEDFPPGRRFGSASLTLDADAIRTFARDFDPQPFHLDEAAATGSIFGGLAASGWQTAALTMRLLVTSSLPIAGGMVGVNVELSWPRPTRPGDILRVESEVIDNAPSRSRPDRGTVTLRSTTLNQRGETLQTMTARLIVPRRPA